MKISLIAPSHIPSRRANSIQSMKMCQAFSQLGHQVLLLVPGDDPNLEWKDLSHHYGLITRFEIEWLSASPSWRRYDFAYKAVQRAKQWGADLIFTRVPQSAALASKLGIPTVFEAHDFPGGRIGPRLIKAFTKGKGAKVLLSITKALADDLQSTFEIPEELIQIAPDGVDLERYENMSSPAEARAQIGLDDVFTVGYTGHLYPGRGSKIILDIAKEIQDVNFLLVGGDPQDQEKLQVKVDEQKLTNIKLTGFVSNTELPLYQAAADILLMPYQKKVSASSGGDISRYLSPMKMFEYLASGRPIISSDLTVLKEILNDKNSVILPAGNLSAWVAEIRNLQTDRDKRESLSKMARQTAERFSWQSRAERLLASLK